MIKLLHYNRFLHSTNPGAKKRLRRALNKTLVTSIIGLLAAGLSVLCVADFQVDSGNAFDLGAGTLDLGCANFTLQSNATFSAGSGKVQLSGDWNNQGTFNRGTSSVVINDDCGAVSISAVTGETYFHDLIATTILAHELQFESGRHQSVENALVLTGAGGQLLRIRSAMAGSPGFLDLDTGGTQTIDYVDVRDNHATFPAQHLAPEAPGFFRSIDGGGNFRWFLSGLEHIPVPTLPAACLVLLVLLLALAPVVKRHKSHLFRP